MLTNFPSYLILYDTLHFPGLDVYLIPFFCEACIFTLPLLPCKNVVVCFWLLPILLHRRGDKGPISADSALSRKSFFVNKLLFPSQGTFLYPLLTSCSWCAWNIYWFSHHPPSLWSLWFSTWFLMFFLHFIPTIFVLYGQTLLLSVTDSWGHQLNVYIWQNWYICVYFCYSNISQRSELQSVATSSTPVLALKSVGAEQMKSGTICAILNLLVLVWFSI